MCGTRTVSHQKGQVYTLPRTGIDLKGFTVLPFINNLSNIFMSLLSWFIGLHFHCSNIALPFPSSLTYLTRDVVCLCLSVYICVELSEHLSSANCLWRVFTLSVPGLCTRIKAHGPVASGYVGVSLMSPNVFLFLPTASVTTLGQNMRGSHIEPCAYTADTGQ